MTRAVSVQEVVCANCVRRLPIVVVERLMQKTAALGLAGLLAASGGCAHYTALPLAPAQPLAAALSDLKLNGVAPDQPLRSTDLAILAVANSPDLAALRRQRGVAEAEVLQAGLLTNPALTAGVLPLVAGPAAPNGPFSSSTIGWDVAISYDVRSLLTRRSRSREAVARARALDADLLWQEWQTIAEARLLSVDVIEGDRLLAVLHEVQALLTHRAEASQLALARGEVTLATEAPDMAALQAATVAASDQERLQLSRRHQLNALLGLMPEVRLTLAATPDLPALDPATTIDALLSLPDRRPDLAALRFGYQAEDERLRSAIVAQFPNLALGVGGASDNSNVRNIGPQITLDLPIFDQNQGQIAIERATRAQLRAEYRARLASAIGQVRALLDETTLVQQQLATLQRGLPEVTRIAHTAQSAQQAGTLDERSALDFILARTTRQQEIVALEQTLLEQYVAIATLSGAGLPPLHMRGQASAFFFEKKNQKTS